MRIGGWRGAALVILGLVVLALLFALVVWAAIGLALVAGVVWLNLVLLPRMARRLGVPTFVLEVICLPLFGGCGWLLGGAVGAGLGALTWLCGIGLPRLAGRRLRARVGGAMQHPGPVIVLETPALREPSERGSRREG